MTDRPGLLSLPDPVRLANRSDERKKLARGFLGPEPSFPGTEGRIYPGVIDAYHGETGLPIDAAATAALNAAWLELTSRELPDEYRDGRLYDKRQPPILRKLAVDTLFRRIAEPGAGLAGERVPVEEVIVCPYSSTVLLEEAVATIARPGGVLVCPEGYYKSASVHVAKYGLRMVSSPATADDTFKIDPKTLRLCLEEHARQGNLCGVMLTLPGNPVVGDYTVDELTEIGRVLVEADVPVICDMSFDLLVENHIPMAAITVPTEHGPVRLHDRVLTITGNSKAYNAFGPCKLGAATTGNAVWLDTVRDRLRVAFQRETTHLVRAVLEHTSDGYLVSNRLLLRDRMATALSLLEAVNIRHGAKLLRPLGSSDGMFLTVEFDADLMEQADVHTGSELEDLLLTVAGIDTVGLDRTGSPRLALRFNVVAPRMAAGQEQPHLLAELFDRLDHLLTRLRSGMTYPNALLERAIPELARVGS
ncbi:aminotransferase class I/II-fold pyridoxal phosphate-dependent enzyme [Nocardia huaxiensis]|uniref:Aminotransferase class I/II-fold pyridoxal phosphate-dependent enzyme n=1 Tax=Nocardia huaxiensis TaxID=2755382 RepID=A0A7D6VEE4_9NOCA|nr:aminotransferase class I/II-fold pyridoxal phosphate-dependent enzyme [Nocardia huaxiensis]QLY30555.1 aminotransferase class I/II-fold pyridoxal phosphate-dependent enzyme [Nocardia huaxiensis]UFS95843.1 aminotransferase class I/II-fold pyridoxal phosphate-dependent enzyme [Nocardia huaxiensis]